MQNILFLMLITHKREGEKNNKCPAKFLKPIYLFGLYEKDWVPLTSILLKITI